MRARDAVRTPTEHPGSKALANRRGLRKLRMAAYRLLSYGLVAKFQGSGASRYFASKNASVVESSVMQNQGFERALGGPEQRRRKNRRAVLVFQLRAVVGKRRGSCPLQIRIQVKAAQRQALEWLGALP